MVLRARVTHLCPMLSRSEHMDFGEMKDWQTCVIISDFFYQHRVAFDGAASEVEVLDTCGCAVGIVWYI